MDYLCDIRNRRKNNMGGMEQVEMGQSGITGGQKTANVKRDI